MDTGSFAHQFAQQIVNGVSLGSIYALIALGYTMIYGIIKLINFAHGDIYMLGAYIGFVAITKAGLPFFPALIVAMIGAALAGILIERIAYKPMRNAPRIAALITAIGVSFFLENGMILLVSPQPRTFPPMFAHTVYHIGGVLVGIYYNSIDPLMGMMPGIKAFIAAVVGGIGILPGAMLGGIIMGLVEAMVSGFFSSTYRDAAAFAILILILLYKPTGLLGKNVKEKV